MDLEKLKNRDYYLLIDKSGSMADKDCPGGKSRWAYCQESVKAISKKLDEYDPDGITVVVFSGSNKMYENTTVDKVDQVFKENEPMGGTDTASALKVVFDTYLKQKKAGTAKANGILALVITDGIPNDEDAVAKAIVNFSKQIDSDEEAGIEFVQIGKDEHAAAYLKRLDDHLTSEGAKFDIVNAITVEEVETLGMQEVLRKAIEE